ncbi:MAG: hypothetical protein RMJ33_02745, partial [Saprospiraceae bacterium]|nr:hypothetical protein [Saprospiraceae bacterium]
MKKLFLILIGWALVAPSAVWSCDICGCSSGAQTLGLLPLVQRHLAGVRWQGQGYRTVAHGSEANSYEYFHSLDFWGRWMPHRRWQVMGFVPYSYNIRRFYDGQRQQVGGLGDVSLLAQFFILDPHQSMTHRWRHALQVGAGVKLPTGDFWMSESLNGQELPIPPALQPGTGSTDALVSALYAVSTHEWIISVDGMLRLTGQNSEGYRFGSRANG